jgi:hypothetical protein
VAEHDDGDNSDGDDDGRGAWPQRDVAAGGEVGPWSGTEQPGLDTPQRLVLPHDPWHTEAAAGGELPAA